MKGRAYIAGYRFMREHDLKPYIYRTDNYGETWTLLTDGKNGMPIDHPTRVIREDPRQAGLLYAGTEFGFFVSFNGGKNWQPLQQNLPATPITDIKVHRNDLVISTMGRSAWIMDNITPLQELARIVNATPTAAGGHDGALAGSGFSRDRIEQQQLPAVALFQPREAIRYRSSTAPLLERRTRVPRSSARSSISTSRARPARTPSSKCSTPAAPRSAPGTCAPPQERRRAGAGDARAILAAAAAARPASAPKPACSASVGPALPRSMDGAESGRRRRRADGAAREVQRPSHLGRPDHHADVRARSRIRASPPTASPTRRSPSR